MNIPSVVYEEQKKEVQIIRRQSQGRLKKRQGNKE